MVPYVTLTCAPTRLSSIISATVLSCRPHCQETAVEIKTATATAMRIKMGIAVCGIDRLQTEFESYAEKFHDEKNLMIL